MADESSGTRPPSVRYQKRPIYPLAMRLLNLGGEVVVDFVVTPEGEAVGARAVRSTLPAFESAAVVAVETWQFKPGTRAGRPEFYHMQVPIVFSMNDGSETEEETSEPPADPPPAQERKQ